MKRRGLPEAFEVTSAHYYVSPPAPLSPVVGPVADTGVRDLYPAGFRNAAVDPSSVYPHLSSYDRLRVRETCAQLWVGGPWGPLADRECALAGVGL